MANGIFDKQQPQMRPAEGDTTVEKIMQPKQDFVNIEKESAVRNRKTADAMSKSATKKTGAEQDIDNVNAIMSGGATEQTKNEKEIASLDTITKEDLEKAEELIFKGYSEFDVPMPKFSNIVITVCSTSADEIDLINEMLFDMVNDNKSEDTGEIEISEANLTTWKTMYQLALAYKGKNREELYIDDSSCCLTTIKRAMVMLAEYEAAGKKEEFDSLKKSVKDVIIKRAIRIRRMPTPFIDFISEAKQKFDKKMFAIMKTDNIIPKS